MKKSRLLATALAAALCAVPLAACGEDPEKKPAEDKPLVFNGKTFDLADYALPISEFDNLLEDRDNYRTDMLKSVTKRNFRFTTLSSENPIVAIEDTDYSSDYYGKYRLYNTKTESFAFSSTYFDAYTSLSDSNNLITRVRTYDEYNSVYVFQYVGPDGKYIVNKKFQKDYSWDTPDVTCDYSYFTNEKGESVRYYTFTYPLDDDGKDTATKYFTYEDYEWTEITESDLEVEREDDGYQVGDSVFARISLGNSKDEDAKFEDYSYITEGDGNTVVYTFFRDGRRLDSLTIKNGDAIAFLGNYLYYYEMELVDKDATEGYNYEIVMPYGESSTSKANWTMWRYDVVNGGEATEVETDYIVIETEATLYNYANHYNDMAVVSILKKVNGVVRYDVISAEFFDTYNAITVMIDENADLSVDLTGKSFSRSSSLYELKADRYLYGNRIVDGDFNTLGTLPTTNYMIWEEEELLVLNMYDYNYGGTNYLFVDFDGNVVIPAISNFDSLTYFGSNILVAKYLTYSTYSYIVYSESNPKGKALEDIVPSYNEKTDTVSLLRVGGETTNVIYKITERKTFTGDYDRYDEPIYETTYVYNFYDLNGRSLGNSFETQSYSSVSPFRICEKYFIQYTDVDGNYGTLFIS